MMIGTVQPIREPYPYIGDARLLSLGVAPMLAGAGGVPVPTRRYETRVTEQKLCRYEVCESITDEAVVIQYGEVYSLNRSAHGILLLMGSRPETRQLLELHIPESRWRRSLNLYEIRWTKLISMDDLGDLFLVGCRLVFGPSRYWDL